MPLVPCRALHASQVGVVYDEARTFQPLGVVDLRADEILEAHRVNQHRNTFPLDHGIVFRAAVLEREAVLKARTATAGNVDTQLQRRVFLLFHQLAHLVHSAGGQIDPGGIECFSYRHTFLRGARSPAMTMMALLW